MTHDRDNIKDRESISKTAKWVKRSLKAKRALDASELQSRGRRIFPPWSRFQDIKSETMVSENARCLVGQPKRSKYSEKSQAFGCSGIWGRGPGKGSSKTHPCESNFITMAAGSRQMTLSEAKRIAQNSDSGPPIHFNI